MSGKVADIPIRIKQAGLLAASFAIAQQLHLKFLHLAAKGRFCKIPIEASGP
jgi:hypothetical protein